MLKSPAFNLLRARDDKRRGGATKIFSRGVTQIPKIWLRRPTRITTTREASCASRVVSGGNQDLHCAQRQAARESSLDGSSRCRMSRVLISKENGVRCDSDVVLQSTRLVAQQDSLALRRHTSYGWYCSPGTTSDLRISNGHVSRFKLSAMMMQHDSSPCDGICKP